MASASSRVAALGTLGPEATTATSSPGMSETTKVTTRAGCATAARRPPLTCDRCFLTAFISRIEAPQARSCRFTARFSSGEIPSGGSESSAEPPPEISATTRSSAPAPSASASIRRAAAKLASSGTGCAASTTGTAVVSTRSPCFTTTSPSSIRLPAASQAASKACAMTPEPLPAPSTMVRPRGGSGRFAAMPGAGSAAATAARYSRSKSSRSPAASMLRCLPARRSSPGIAEPERAASPPTGKGTAFRNRVARCGDRADKQPSFAIDPPFAARRRGPPA